jgi:hypothetical protein
MDVIAPDRTVWKRRYPGRTFQDLLSTFEVGTKYSAKNFDGFFANHLHPGKYVEA